MKIRTGSKTVSVSLQYYHGGWNAGAGPDCFDDMEDNFAREHQRQDGDTAILCTDAELTNMLEWWEAEVKTANSGEDGEALAGISEDAREQGDEWLFSAREIWA